MRTDTRVHARMHGPHMQWLCLARRVGPAAVGGLVFFLVCDAIDDAVARREAEKQRGLLQPVHLAPIEQPVPFRSVSESPLWVSPCRPASPLALPGALCPTRRCARPSHLGHCICPWEAHPACQPCAALHLSLGLTSRVQALCRTHPAPLPLPRALYLTPAPSTAAPLPVPQALLRPSLCPPHCCTCLLPSQPREPCAQAPARAPSAQYAPQYAPRHCFIRRQPRPRPGCRAHRGRAGGQGGHSQAHGRRTRGQHTHA